MAWIIAALAFTPLAMLLVNLRLYRPPKFGSSPRAKVSVLIPARNEAQNIGRAIEAVLANDLPSLELLVLDDASDDETANIVKRAAIDDPRVRLIEGTPVPSGASGKAHACQQLADKASGDVLIFVDADVELSRTAVPDLVACLIHGEASLISGVPHQLTKTIAEKLLVPLIHCVLLGYLPIGRMRASKSPAYGAACGQLCVVKKRDYDRIGGHRAILGSFHDGLALSRAFRRAGFSTDLVDADGLATCRMYHSAIEVWNGFAKNAHEGIGSPAGLIPWTVILIGGQVLPVALIVSGYFSLPIVGAVLASFATRALLALRFGQSWIGVLLHPAAVFLFVATQWWGAIRRWSGKPVTWKGRRPPIPVDQA